MARIVINVKDLPIPEKLMKGEMVISKGTDNPDVPGNEAVIASFSDLQTAFSEASAAYEATRQQLQQLMAARDAAEAKWLIGLKGVAGFTQAATDGDPVKILSAGFDVRRERTAPVRVEQVRQVRVSFTGNPGYSEVRWKREANADAYAVERSPDPITETSWGRVGTVTEPKYMGNGATPGQRYWYRVAGVNRLGQGPWSEPALRPVM